jgi:hypothetical protein
VRAAIGTSFYLWGQEGFVNTESGHRSRGDCERSVEVAVGLEFAPDWNLTFKAWQEQGGAETGRQGGGRMRGLLGCSALAWAGARKYQANFEEKGWVVNSAG